MKKKRRQPSPKAGGVAVLPEKKARRKPVFTLTPQQVIQRCRDSCHELICAGQVLAVMDLMRLAGWPIGVLAKRARFTHNEVTLLA